MSDLMFERTERGFSLIKFEDTHGIKCTIQKSSSGLQDSIWFGTEGLVKVLVPGEGWIDHALPKESLVFSRMHLSQEQVKAILPVLQHFVEHGDLPEEGVPTARGIEGEPATLGETYDSSNAYGTEGSTAFSAGCDEPDPETDPDDVVEYDIPGRSAVDLLDEFDRYSPEGYFGSPFAKRVSEVLQTFGRRDEKNNITTASSKAMVEMVARDPWGPMCKVEAPSQTWSIYTEKSDVIEAKTIGHSDIAWVQFLRQGTVQAPTFETAIVSARALLRSRGYSGPFRVYLGDFYGPKMQEHRT